MKTKYILAGLFALSLSSCKDQFLDLSPIAQANSNTFYKTSSDMITALNGAYGALQFNGNTVRTTFLPKSHPTIRRRFCPAR